MFYWYFLSTNTKTILECLLRYVAASCEVFIAIVDIASLSTIKKRYIAQPYFEPVLRMSIFFFFLFWADEADADVCCCSKLALMAGWEQGWSCSSSCTFFASLLNEDAWSGVARTPFNWNQLFLGSLQTKAPCRHCSAAARWHWSVDSSGGKSELLETFHLCS